jgi:hypothetical protein
VERFVALRRKSVRVSRRIALGAVFFAVFFSGCAGSSQTETTGTPTVTPTYLAATSAPGGGATGSSLPLGDGKFGLTPQAGAIMLCSTTFSKGGADHDGPWIDAAAGTWNPTLKIAVRGSVAWTQAQLQISTQGSTRTITTNDLPMGQPTGTFPIAPSDPAYAYDRNPNHIAAQNLSYTLPANPAPAGQPSCLHGGPIGVTLDGVVLYDGLDAGGRDAVAHEVQDVCDGHPDGHSMYHYHAISPCLLKTATGSSTLVGYALDGFGIYVERDASGALLTDGDLDACHGRVSTVEWDGKQVSMYHYDATAAYPYTLGCFKGTPVAQGGPPA